MFVLSPSRNLIGPVTMRQNLTKKLRGRTYRKLLDTLWLKLDTVLPITQIINEQLIELYGYEIQLASPYY